MSFSFFSEAKTEAESSPSETIFWERIGTKAEVKAPSAKRLRNRLGSLKATKNASAIMPAPKNLAKTMSRMKPVMRLSSVNPPKVATDLNSDIRNVPLVSNFLCFIKYSL